MAVLVVADCAFILLGGALAASAVRSRTLTDLFGLLSDSNLPAWYSSLKLLILATLVAALAFGCSTDERPDRRILLVAFVLGLMAIDESTAVHERLQGVLSVRAIEPFAASSAAATVLGKVILGLVALCLLLVVIASAVSGLGRVLRGKTLMATGLGFLVLGAVGIDLAQEAVSFGSAGAAVALTAEEACEFIGVTLMIGGVLLAIGSAPVSIRLGTRITIAGERMSAAGGRDALCVTSSSTADRGRPERVGHL